MGGKRVSQKVVMLATEMFAKSTGFSGPQIHQLFGEYTDVLGSYSSTGGGPSRWQLFQNGLDALSAEEQRRLLLDLCEYDGPRSHPPPSDDNIAKLRNLLLGDTTPGALAASERLADLDWDHVQRAWSNALAKVLNDPEGAITATRTLLEGICKHILDERGVAYDDGADLNKLYKQTAAAMDLAPDQHGEQVIKQILSGTMSVVNGLAAMRNSLSDAHGRGKKSARPAPRHATLAVNTGFGIAGFLIDTHIEKPVRPEV